MNYLGAGYYDNRLFDWGYIDVIRVTTIAAALLRVITIAAALLGVTTIAVALLEVNTFTND